MAISWALGSPAISSGDEKSPHGPLSVGPHRELFVDDFLIDRLSGAQLTLQQPVPREVVLIHNEPWEGNICAYHTVFQDGDLYRIYYRGGHYDEQQAQQTQEQLYCYAESRDGVAWTKPALGLFDHGGSSANNIIVKGIGSHNFAPFKDANPNCSPEAPYKAVGNGPGGMHALKSTDGIHWSSLGDGPIITEGAFDSQNLAFWDSVRERYVDFHRDFREGVRDIKTCTSQDFLKWTDPDWLEYRGAPPEHLYTNAITACPGAPQFFVGFPKRFVPTRNPAKHPYPGVSDGVFMTSRDGHTFTRWPEAFLRPGPQPDRWVNRNNMIAWGIVTTASDQPGAPEELSIYATEGYYRGDAVRLRRYTLRQDGFVSVHARASGGELVTKAFTFEPQEVRREKTEDASRDVAITREHNAPIAGKTSLRFRKPATIALPGTQVLGAQFTLAAHLRDVPAGHRRLFSAYDGGSSQPGELYFDFNSDGNAGVAGAAIRFAWHDTLVTVPTGAVVGDWSKEAGGAHPHHLAVTWDEGHVTIYFDGQQVAVGGTRVSDPVQLALGDLLLGEDYPPTELENEPLIGVVDNVVVLRRTLNADEVKALAVGKLVDALHPHEERGLLYDAEESGEELVDRAIGDGQQIARLSTSARPADVQLHINFATSAAGSVRCEIQNAKGQPLRGHSLAECDEMYGDQIEQVVSWQGNREVKSLVGQVIRLRFVLQDADLYSLQFQSRR